MESQCPTRNDRKLKFISWNNRVVFKHCKHYQTISKAPSQDLIRTLGIHWKFPTTLLAFQTIAFGILRITMTTICHNQRNHAIRRIEVVEVVQVINFQAVTGSPTTEWCVLLWFDIHYLPSSNKGYLTSEWCVGCCSDKTVLHVLSSENRAKQIQNLISMNPIHSVWNPTSNPAAIWEEENMECIPFEENGDKSTKISIFKWCIFYPICYGDAKLAF